MHALPLYNSLGNQFAFLEWQEIFFDPANITAQQVREYLVHTPSAHGLLILKTKSCASTIPQSYIFNSDGSYGEFSGNGARIIATLLMERTQQNQVTFTMGSHRIRAEKQTDEIALWFKPGQVQRQQSLLIHHKNITFYFVNMGNPHALFFHDLSLDDFYSIAPTLASQLAPDTGINLSMIQQIEPHHYRLTTFERGVGATPACSSAALALSSFLSQEPELKIQMPGGTIRILRKQSDIIIISKKSIKMS